MDHNDGAWVDQRLESLEPPSGWQPDSAAALRRFRGLQQHGAVARQRRVWFAIGAVAACLAAIVLWPRLTNEPEPVRHAPGVVAANYRESGSAKAPIVAEIYSDYQCGHCATLLLETVPRLQEEYVRTGKVRLLHRDLPLPQHQYARLAAKYANAAGRIGRYQAAVDRLFRTQAQWSADGNIGARLADIVPASAMESARNDANLDAGIDADIEQARQDDIRMTPAMVVTANGRRRTLAPVPEYPFLKDYLDGLLKPNCHEDPQAARC